MSSNSPHRKSNLQNSAFDDTIKCRNLSLTSLPSEKDNSPYKSPTILSFDAYGNLTSSDDPDAPYSHEVPSLEEFDYILNSFEGRFTNSSSNEPERSLPSKKNGLYKKNKSKKVKRNITTSSESVSLSDNDLKQAFKKDFDTTALGITSRYGRTRKQKKSDGFLFGTLNFNELRKITSNSPPKNVHSSVNDEIKSEDPSNSKYGKQVENTILLDSKTEDNNKLNYGKQIEETVLLNTKSKVVSKSKYERQIDEIVHMDAKKLKYEKQIEETIPLDTIEEPCKSKYGKQIEETVLLNVAEELDKSIYGKQIEDTLLLNTIEESSKSKYGKQIEETVLLDAAEEPDKSIYGKHIEETVLLDAIEEPNKTKYYEQIEETVLMGANGEDSNKSKYGKQIEDLKSEDSNISKFGRQIKKTILLDVSVHKKIKRESPEKQSSSVIEEEFLDTPSTNDLEIEKEYPCIFFIGDLVWVNVKGNPLWPGMITYPLNETNFTKFRYNATTNKLKGPRKYHVQFFFDNHKTMWVSSYAIFPYKGLENLSLYFEKVKLNIKDIKITEKNLLKSFSKMSLLLTLKANSSKALQWYQAIEEVNQALTLERYERIQHFKALPKEGKKRKLTQSDTVKSPDAKGAPPPPAIIPDLKPEPPSEISSISSIKCETFSNKSRSSDDFSGFDEDSSFERRKAKRCKLEKRLKRGGDFEVYLQKHLDSTIESSNLTKEKAKKLLQKKWNKLTPAQKLRYRSKLSYDQLSSADTDESSSDLSSITSYKSKKIALHEEESHEPSKGTYKVPRNEKVCVSCESGSNKSGMDMTKCKGVCGSYFHLSCVGLDTVLPTDFKCVECLSGSHKCFLCKSEEGERHKCSVTFCGKFYHEHCLKAWPHVSRITKSRQTEKFVCPRHVCHMCSANADDMNDPAARTPPYTRCLRCPTTYHTGETCIAAGVEEISHNYHICTKHIQYSKWSNHHFNVNWCFCCSKGGSLLLCDQCPAAFHAECLNITAPEGGYVCEDCENGKFPVYGDIVWVKLGQYRWWPGEVLHPRYIPDNIENLHHVQGMFCVHFFGSDDYYWLSRGRTFHYQEGDQGSKSSASKLFEQKFQKALDEAVVAYRKQKEKREMQEQNRSLKGNMKPPPYVKIDTNRPVGSVRLGKLDPSTITKCDCDPYSENPCGSDDKCINRMLMVECIKEVCAGKERCNNQRFQRRQYPNVFPFKTSGRGWGLKTKDAIKKGSFVIEYVGELIDEAEFRRRIDEMHDNKEQNYYFLTVETDRMIDAGPKGNLARFMNHSCQPNCETQKWTVGADTRVGLFALEDIPEGSELTFNYNLECVGTEKKICNCGAANCSGFIGVKVQKCDVSGSAKKVESGIKKKKRGRKRKNEKDSENECFRCGYEGDLILCDVTTCPKGYHLNCLGLKELPKGKWICPWHHCDDCGSRAVSKCIMCPNSYCKIHTNDKFNPSPGLENVCMDHCAEDLEALRGQMKVEMKCLQAEATVPKCPPEGETQMASVEHLENDSNATAVCSSLEIISRTHEKKCGLPASQQDESRVKSNPLSSSVDSTLRQQSERVLRSVSNNNNNNDKVHNKNSSLKNSVSKRSLSNSKEGPQTIERKTRSTGNASKSVTDGAARVGCFKENSR